MSLFDSIKLPDFGPINVRVAVSTTPGKKSWDQLKIAEMQISLTQIGKFLHLFMGSSSKIIDKLNGDGITIILKNLRINGKLIGDVEATIKARNDGHIVAEVNGTKYYIYAYYDIGKDRSGNVVWEGWDLKYEQNPTPILQKYEQKIGRSRAPRSFYPVYSTTESVLRNTTSNSKITYEWSPFTISDVKKYLIDYNKSYISIPLPTPQEIEETLHFPNVDGEISNQRVSIGDEVPTPTPYTTSGPSKDANKKK